MIKALDVEALIGADAKAHYISDCWVRWRNARLPWENECSELRNFIYATDTRHSADSEGHWANTTTMPKLTAIYDTLKANYSKTLFPRDKSFSWIAGDEKSVPKAKVIESYIKTKLDEDKAEVTIDSIVDDWILYGNCFGEVDWVDESLTYGEDSGLPITVEGFKGPRIFRISPNDIVFNPSAASFKNTPKVVRKLVTIGTLKTLVEPDVFRRISNNRHSVAVSENQAKDKAYIADGFGTITEYYTSGSVELLTFYGDMYDQEAGEYLPRRKVVVADRAYVIEDIEIPSWTGDTPIHHSGWRARPDNLWAMGPLANLVGMQHRIDQLENSKADIFDFSVMPMTKVIGDVEDFVWEPGGRITIPLADQGDVQMLNVPIQALQANNEIISFMSLMEEFAGAPRQAAGIRTPGEKTAFEVEQLENNANKTFQHKAAKFEKELLEPLYHTMLQVSVQNLKVPERLRVFDEELEAEIWASITKEDLQAKGSLRPMGARRFAEKQREVQELNAVLAIKAADPTIGVHLSGKRIAKKLADYTTHEDLYEENVGIEESKETQEAQLDAEAAVTENLQIKSELGE